MKQDVIQKSLKEQISLISENKISSFELTKIYLDKIEKENAALNIVVNLDPKAALDRARYLDQAFKVNGPVGPLHGIPFTIKDAFRAKGFGTSYGWPGLQYLKAKDNCTIVQRLIDAGGILIGQTNVPLSCFDWQSNSPIYGLTKNPLNPERTVGGSSGGAAASVAAHFSAFEVGSDVAGSIRHPAHCCGVYGLRPTHNFVPFHDIGPSLHKESFSNLAVGGPIARSIEDLKFVLSILTKTQDDSFKKQTLKIAYSLKWKGTYLSHKSEQRIAKALSQIQRSGHELIKYEPKFDLEKCLEVWGLILGYEYKKMIPALGRLKPFINIFNYYFNQKRLNTSAFQNVFEKGLFASKADYEAALESAKKLREQYEEEFQDFDLWITPVAPTEAFEHKKAGESFNIDGMKDIPYTTIGSFLSPTALLHHPVLVIPLKEVNEHPIGIQLHGKFGKDWQLIRDSISIDKIL